MVEDINVSDMVEDIKFPRNVIADRMRQTFDVCGDVWFKRAAEALDQGWLPMATAPKTAKEVLLLVKRHSGSGWPTTMRIVAHWAQDLSGSEQPSFSGWFRDTGYGFSQVTEEILSWSPLYPELPERIQIKENTK